MGKPVEIVASLTADAVAKLKASKDAEKYQSLPDEGKEVKFQYDFGDNTEESVAIFTDNVCRSMIVGHIKFTIQSIARSMLKAGKTEEEIRAHFFNARSGENVYKPGEYTGRKSGVEKEHDRIIKLSPEVKAKEIAKLQEMLAGLEKGK